MIRALQGLYVMRGAYLPIGIFPARAYPVFQQSNSVNDNQFFTQVVSANGMISNFRQMTNDDSSRILKTPDEHRTVMVGREAVFSIADASGKLWFCSGEAEFRELIEEYIERDKHDGNPFFSLEVARALGSVEKEVEFACDALDSIVQVSSSVARRWIAQAPLGDEARLAAAYRYDRHVSIDDEVVEKAGAKVVYFTARISNLLDRSVGTKSVHRVFSDLHALVVARRKLAPNVVVVHAEDFGSAAFEEFIDLVDKKVSVVVAVPFAISGEVGGWWRALPVKAIGSMSNTDLSEKITSYLEDVCGVGFADTD